VRAGWRLPTLTHPALDCEAPVVWEPGFRGSGVRWVEGHCRMVLRMGFCSGSIHLGGMNSGSPNRMRICQAEWCTIT